MYFRMQSSYTISDVYAKSVIIKHQAVERCVAVVLTELEGSVPATESRNCAHGSVTCGTNHHVPEVGMDE